MVAGNIAIPRFDEIGPWSQVKLDIVKDYATEYSRILTKQMGLTHAYIDAFAGAGVAKLKVSDDYVLGSPLNALLTVPPFRHYYFVDLDERKASFLRGLVAEQMESRKVSVYEGDANSVLLQKVFPQVRYKDYKRALCLLDPYGLHLHWKVVETAGKDGGIELFINFPVYDININVLPEDSHKQKPSDAKRMNSFWGDASWRSHVYSKAPDLFSEDCEQKINTIKVLVKEYQRRLRNVAGFKYVPDPIPMRNTRGGIVYYLFFASPNQTGAKIVEYIFEKAASYVV